MSDRTDSRFLVLSLQRALRGSIHAQLRQASIEVDVALCIVRLRFEYDGIPNEVTWENCSCAAAEVIADFGALWQLDEQHVPVAGDSPCCPLAHVAYQRMDAARAA
jgi:hypothetical protein